MKFKITAKNFSDLFITAQDSYTVYVRSGFLTVQTINGFYCERSTAVEADGDGAFCLSKSFVAKLKGFASADVLECEVKDNALHIKCGSFKARYKTYDAQEDKSTDFDAFNKVIKLDEVQLKAIQNLRAFASKYDSSVEFTGIEFYISDNKLRLSATNRSHLAVYTFGLGEGEFSRVAPGTNIKLILPANIVANFKYFAGGANMFYDEKTQKILIHDDNTMLMFHSILGHFPDIDDVIAPIKRAKSFSLDTGALADAVNKLTPTGKVLAMQFLPDNIQVTATSDEGEEASITLDYLSDARPDELTFPFYASTIANYLKLTNGNAMFYYKDATHPILFSEDNLDYVTASLR